MSEQTINIEELIQDDHNFNKGTEAGQKLMEKSFNELGAGRSILVDKDGRIISGNKSHKAAIAAGIQKVRVIETNGDELIAVKRTDISLDSKEGREMAYADNLTTQVNLAWDENELEHFNTEVEWFDISDWGFDAKELAGLKRIVPKFGEDDAEPKDPEEDTKPLNKYEKIEEAELLLNKAMQQYCGEFAEQIDHAMQQGWLCTGLTPGFAKLQFLKAKYYGRRYMRKNSLIFTPRQFFTSGKTTSYYEALKLVAEKGETGIDGLRTLSNDGNLSVLFHSSYPIGSARMPLDFPVELGSELIKTFANKGRVLDPCHGWGGRLTAALLEEVAEYVGVDPSPDAHAGVSKIYDTFKEYQQTKCTLIRQPYEDTQIEGGFDFALTSPPYFDVEQYAGEEQAHVKYGNYDRWRESFYRPLIKLTMERLKDGGVFALQVGSQKYPLREDAIAIAQDLGYTAEVWREHCVGTDGTIHKTDKEKSEAVILIRRQ